MGMRSVGWGCSVPRHSVGGLPKAGGEEVVGAGWGKEAEHALLWVTWLGEGRLISHPTTLDIYDS